MLLIILGMMIKLYMIMKRIMIIVIVRLMMEIYLVSWFCWVDFFWLFLIDDSKERIIVVYLKGKLNKRVIRVRVR